VERREAPPTEEISDDGPALKPLTEEFALQKPPPLPKRPLEAVPPPLPTIRRDPLPSELPRAKQPIQPPIKDDPRVKQAEPAEAVLPPAVVWQPAIPTTESPGKGRPGDPMPATFSQIYEEGDEGVEFPVVLPDANLERVESAPEKSEEDLDELAGKGTREWEDSRRLIVTDPNSLLCDRAGLAESTALAPQPTAERAHLEAHAPTDKRAEPSMVRPGQKLDMEDLIDMTAMVDIVFFLLIFFLVKSMHSLDSTIPMPAPDPQKGAAREPQSVAAIDADESYIVVRVDKNDKITVEGAEVRTERELLFKLRDLRLGAARPEKLMVIGHGDATHGTAVMIMDAGRELGIDQVKLSVRDEEE
jgi:biopolymer transport protein ExbD